MNEAELRERLDTIETMLTYIMNSLMAGQMKVAVEEYPDAEGMDEIVEVMKKLSDDAGEIMGQYIEDYYTERKEDEDDEN